MIRSVRLKVLIYMVLNILVFAFLLYAANLLFAEKFYLRQKKEMLINAGNQINSLTQNKTSLADFQGEKLQNEITLISENIAGDIVIGPANAPQYFPLNHSGNGRPNMLVLYDKNGQLPNISGFQHEDSEAHSEQIEPQGDKAFFIAAKDAPLKLETLRYQLQMDNGLYLQIWIPMAEITESAAISNQFTLLIGLFAIFFSGVSALYFSKMMTNPIQRINQIARKMSRLDFSEAIQVAGEDEIAQLSLSINHLSAELDNTIKLLNEKNRQLEADIDHERKLDKMRREFVSSVSHELKTPIFLIQGYADGLKANIVSDEQKKDFYCAVIMEEAEKMDKLVKDLLDLSQVQSGMFEINCCEFEIKKLVLDVTAKFGPILAEKMIALEIQSADGLIVSADPFRIEQVIVNYLNNAVSHIDEKRQIKVEITRQAEKVRVSVFNTGQPIPAEALEKIWISFYKVDPARRRDFGRTGLGLSIVKAILEAHHNQYGVNNLSDGVEFWFELNLSK